MKKISPSKINKIKRHLLKVRVRCPACCSPESIIFEKNKDEPYLDYACIVCGYPWHIMVPHASSPFGTFDDSQGYWANGIRILEDGE